MIKANGCDFFVTEPRVTLVDHSGMDLTTVLSEEEINEFQAAGRYCGTDFENKIEFMARLCYDSHANGRPTPDYHRNIIESRHSSVAEHASLSFLIQGVSRGLTHEQVRQRVGCSYSQRSTRYVDESGFRLVLPPEFEGDLEEVKQQVALTRRLYTKDFKAAKARGLDNKRARGVARSWLPNGCETEIGITFNLVSFLHFLALRGSRFADYEMPRLAVAMLKAARHLSPLYLGVIELEEANGQEFVVTDSIPFEGRRYGK